MKYLTKKETIKAAEKEHAAKIKAINLKFDLMEILPGMSIIPTSSSILIAMADHSPINNKEDFTRIINALAPLSSIKTMGSIQHYAEGLYLVKCHHFINAHVDNRRPNIKTQATKEEVKTQKVVFLTWLDGEEVSISVETSGAKWTPKKVQQYAYGHTYAICDHIDF